MRNFLVIVSSIFVILLNSCDYNSTRPLLNSNGDNYDVFENNINVPEPVSLEFGLSSWPSVHQGLDSCLLFQYSFCFPCSLLPTIRLNSFSFTIDKDTIPFILYYRIDGDRVEFIEKLPILFDNTVKKKLHNVPFEIVAESNEKYDNIEGVFVSYDIEVGTKRYVKRIEYKSKIKYDFRPNF